MTVALDITLAMLGKFLIVVTVATIASAGQPHHEDDHHDHHDSHPHEHPKPYSFGYEIHDKDGKQHRHEYADGTGSVKGSYGFIDNHGVHRLVHYVADHHGFRAEVKTNEKGTDNQDPAHVSVDSTYHEDHHHGIHQPDDIRHDDHHSDDLHHDDHQPDDLHHDDHANDDNPHEDHPDDQHHDDYSQGHH